MIFTKPMKQYIQSIETALRNLQNCTDKLTRELETDSCLKEYKFSLDGVLLGEIGRAYAMCYFDLTQRKKNLYFQDRPVKVILTKSHTGIFKVPDKEDCPTYLVVLNYNTNGNISVIYNGLIPENEKKVSWSATSNATNPVKVSLRDYTQ